ncbi:uncharacterized protein LOC133841898 [Drosophila sulfurigaster albostrigata]|uniref:uncharacterized protein LOC133841898 n=1 Tax=Drosophila sulfurigaster albostrigata TaxID=89887 RepID=UPI002D21EB96|nr:uncharacterized protein LOC133841898 [Drosophila sulfurigaster albostrigata]
MDIVEKPIISELNGAKKLKKALTPPPSEIDMNEPIYDYMKYNNKKKSKAASMLKNTKRVSFKRIVEQVTFTDDWKMLTSESNLRTEEEQRKSSNLRRNF